MSLGQRLQNDFALAAQCRARSLQRAIYRGNRGVQGLRYFRGRPAQHFDQQQHGALLRRQALERGHEREADTLLQHCGSRRIGICGQGAGVRDRLEPMRARALGEFVVHRTGRALFHRPRPPRAVTQFIEAHIRCDAVQPGAQRGSSVESLQISPRADDGLLHGIVGVDGRAEHPVAVASQSEAVYFELVDARHHLHQPNTARRPVMATKLNTNFTCTHMLRMPLSV